MSFIPLNKPGQVGLILDVPEEDAPQSAWTDGKDILFKEDRVQKAKGWKEVFSSGNTGEKILWFFPWNDGSTLWWVYATKTSIFRAKDGQRQEITREDSNGNIVDYSASEDTVFSGGVFNGVPVVNNDTFVDPPQQWDDSNTRMKELDNWPNNLFCKFIQPFKSFLVAYNLEDAGSPLPLTLQWSAVADPGTVPTSWDYTDATILAGRSSLAQTTGEILGAKTLQGENVIYKRDAIVSMRFAGGNFVFNFDYISEDEGALAPHCMTSFLGRHFVVTRGDVKVNDGRSLESVIRGKNRRFLFNAMNPDYSERTYVAHDFVNQEIWICFVNESEDPNAVWPNTALVWDYHNQTWTIRSLPGAAFTEQGIVSTSQGSQLWNDQNENWDDVSREWGEAQFDPTSLSLLSTDTVNGKFMDINEGFTQDGTVYRSFVQRVGAPILDEVEQETGELNPARNKFIRRIYPKIDSSKPVKIRVGVQRIYNGPVDWDPTFTFDPSTDRKIDVRLNGKYLAFEIRQEEQVDFEFTGLSLEFESLGEGVR